MTLAGLSNRQKVIRVLALLLGLIAAAMLATSALDRQAQGPTHIVSLSPADLEVQYSTLHELFRSGSIDEQELFSEFARFESSHPAMAKHLHEWSRQYPASAAAQLAVGSYYTHMARLVRSSRAGYDINAMMRDAMSDYAHRAKRAFEAALKLEPASLPAYTGLLAIQTLTGDDQALIQTTFAAFREFPMSAMLHRAVLAGLSRKSGGTDAAMTNYVVGVGATLQDEELEAELWRAVDYWRAQARFGEGNLKGALTLVNYRIEQRTTSDYLVLRARLHWQQSNAEAALADLDQALSSDADYTDAHILKAKIQSFGRSLDEALAHWKIVLEQDPLNPEFLSSYALALHINGRSDAAIPVLQKALVVGAHDHTIRDDLVSHYERLNRYEDAVREMEIVMTLRDGDPYYWRRAITLFANANDCRAQDLAEDFRRMCRSEDCSSAGDPVTLALISRPRLTQQCNTRPTVTALSLDK